MTIKDASSAVSFNVVTTRFREAQRPIVGYIIIKQAAKKSLDGSFPFVKAAYRDSSSKFDCYVQRDFNFPAFLG